MKHSQLSKIMSTIMEHIPDATNRQLIDIANTLDPIPDDIATMTDSQLLDALKSRDDEPLFDRCNTLGQLIIILVAGLTAPIFFLVHIVKTFYYATFKHRGSPTMNTNTVTVENTGCLLGQRLVAALTGHGIPYDKLVDIVYPELQAIADDQIIGDWVESGNGTTWTLTFKPNTNNTEDNQQ